MLWQVLTNIGLSEKSSKVYLSLLELGSQPASVIAKKANINRTTCYVILEDLMKKGLVSTYDKQSVKYFAAEPPAALETYLDNEEKKINYKKDFLANNLNALMGIVEERTLKPKVQYFEGIEGIKAVYTDTLNESKEILSFWGIDEIPAELQKWIFDEYIPKRVKNNIQLRSISPRKPKARLVKKQDDSQLRETVLIPGSFDLKIEINIYMEKVAFMAYSNEEYAGIIIESPRINESMRNIHKMAWKFGESLDL